MVLVIDACVLVAVRVPLDTTHVLRPRTAVRFVAVGILTALAMFSVGSHRGGDYSVSRITSLERDVGAVSDSTQTSNARETTTPSYCPTQTPR